MRFVYYFVSSFLLCLGSGRHLHRDYSSYNWLLSMTVHTVAGVGVFMVSSYSILSRNTRRSSFSLSSTNNKNSSIDSYINNDSPLSSSSSFLVDTINTTSVVTADESLAIPTEKKKNTALNTTMMTMGSTDDDEAKLYCRVMGYYPFPKKTTATTNSQQLFGIGRFWKWLLKDTHQAIIITQQQQQQQQQHETIKVRMDFMTKGGANHPVWYNEIVKWHVWLGGTIDGEIRIKVTGGGGGAEQRQRRQQQRGTTLSTPSSSTVAYSPTMQQLITYATNYNCHMNLYTNNCRMFTARIEREVERLNQHNLPTNRTTHTSDGTPLAATAIAAAEIRDRSSRSSSQQTQTQNIRMRSNVVAADTRCAVRIIWAAVLPLLYPLGIILLIYKGVFY